MARDSHGQVGLFHCYLFMLYHTIYIPYHIEYTQETDTSRVNDSCDLHMHNAKKNTYVSSHMHAQTQIDRLWVIP